MVDPEKFLLPRSQCTIWLLFVLAYVVRPRLLGEVTLELHPWRWCRLYEHVFPTCVIMPNLVPLRQAVGRDPKSSLELG